MSGLDALGYAAALASMVSFVPQAWKILRHRKTSDISAGMYGFTVAAFALWLAYGILLKQWPLVMANGVCFLLSAFILGMTLLPKAGKKKLADSLTGRK